MSLMDEAIRSLRQDVPPEQQDELAQLVMQLTGRLRPTYVPGPEDSADLDESEAAAQRGEFAGDDEVRAIWSKHGL